MAGQVGPDRWLRFDRMLLSGEVSVTVATRVAGVGDAAARRRARELVDGQGGAMIDEHGGAAPIPDRALRGPLTLAEREEIAVLLAQGWSFRRIGRQLRRSHTTIAREIARHRPAGQADRPVRLSRYRATSAHAKAVAARRRPQTTKLSQLPAVCRVVGRLLRRRWSPQQIAAWLRRMFPDNPNMQISHESIYQAIYVQGRGVLRAELHQFLRSGRAERVPRLPRRGQGFRAGIADKVMISQRPAEVEDRAIPGHWEGDLIVGQGGRSAIGTLVERTTRYVVLLHLPGRHDAASVRDQITVAMADWPTTLKVSLTWDQGNEMARHRETTRATGLQVFFCDPHSPWQRGTNENTNRLLRQYFPKGTDLSVHTADDLAHVARELNARPRQTLNWHTPREAMDQLLAVAS